MDELALHILRVESVENTSTKARRRKSAGTFQVKPIHSLMDGQSSTSGDRHRRDIVEGFKFPIADADTVERLEVAVRKSKQTRDEYVSFASCSTRSLC